jgi:4-amino-4-deoxy-L-arabinose transferase-like glycosyltransferase
MIAISSKHQETESNLWIILNHKRYFLLAIFVLSLIVRSLFILKFGSFAQPQIGTDAFEFDSYAWNIANGNGYRGPSPAWPDGTHLTSHRPPGFTYQIALLYKLFGHRYDIVLFVNGLIGSLTAILIALIGIVAFSPLIGLLSGFIYACYPIATYYTASFGAETLFTFLFTFLIFACIAINIKKAHFWQAIMLGFITGITILTRAEALIVPIIAFWIILTLWKTKKQCIKFIGIYSVTFLLVLSPWTLRNYRVHKVFMPLSSIGGQCLLGGNNRIVTTDPKYYGYWYFEGNIPEYKKALEGLGEAQRDHKAMLLALDFLKNHKDKWWFLAWHKTKRFWSPFIYDRQSIEYWIMLFSWGPIFVFFIPGFFILFVYFIKKRSQSIILLLSICYTIPYVILFYGISRMRIGVEGLCLIIAVWTFIQLFHWIRDNKLLHFKAMSIN